MFCCQPLTHEESPSTSAQIEVMRRNKTEAGIAQLEQTMATAFNIMEDNQYMRLKKTAKQDETLIASMSKLVRDVTHQNSGIEDLAKHVSSLQRQIHEMQHKHDSADSAVKRQIDTIKERVLYKLGFVQE